MILDGVGSRLGESLNFTLSRYDLSFTIELLKMAVSRICKLRMREISSALNRRRELKRESTKESKHLD